MKILIFSSSAGNGHNSTAKRLIEKITKNDPTAQVKLIDSYGKYASKIKAWTMKEGYFLACNHLVSVYNHFFKESEKSTYENRNKSKANGDVNCLLHGMLKEIYDFKPDLIIATYIFCALALRNLKRVYPIPAKIMCMTLDYGISPYWECCAEGLDKMFLTGNYMLKPFLEKGYTKKQLVVSGIPVAEEFSTPEIQGLVRRRLNLKENIFTLLIMKGGFFPVKNIDLIREFAKINKPIQIIIINGQDEKSKAELDKLLKKYPQIHHVVNVGFTHKMVDYLKSADLVLGKAGGLSTTETINAGVPSLILNKLPQQEIYNMQFLVSHGCAIETSKSQIAHHINSLLSFPKNLTKMKEMTKKIKKPESLEKMYQYISSVPVADYSKAFEVPNKHLVIKEVNRARKAEIKAENKIRRNAANHK